MYVLGAWYKRKDTV